MKNFTIFFLLFMGGLFSLDRGGAWLLDNLYERVRSGQRGGLVNTYLDLTPPPIVLMGDSRLVSNICPDSLGPGTFSLGHHGTTQIFHTALLSVLRQKQKLPRTILLHVDLDEYLRPSYPEDIQYLKYYYGQDPLVTAYTNEWTWLAPLKFSFALYRHNSNVASLAKNYVSSNPDAPLNQGYEPETPSPQDSVRTLYALEKLNAEPPYLNRAHLRYLREFIAICKQEQMELICFTATYYQQPRHLAATSALVDSVLRAESIPYINYAQQPITELSNNLRYWHDATHLNARGIPLHSQDLARRVAEVRARKPLL
ncbi:hypothetical protein H8B13_18990 [Hymenobacter sp. BT188]|uniref:hypothetical protein n=1 Tax=Hymenobacter sp. BT188 TaxID=2763504 RepID=UPI0016513248|nr:hypothetical protein [Hymenobacter sp. BT188]MBC6608915.1 hypothetical protein [Hymenobacter sp. BT188]